MGVVDEKMRTEEMYLQEVFQFAAIHALLKILRSLLTKNEVKPLIIVMGIFLSLKAMVFEKTI